MSGGLWALLLIGAVLAGGGAGVLLRGTDTDGGWGVAMLASAVGLALLGVGTTIAFGWAPQ